MPSWEYVDYSEGRAFAWAGGSISMQALKAPVKPYAAFITNMLGLSEKPGTILGNPEKKAVPDVYTKKFNQIGVCCMLPA
jgi:hypothetical protein